jgi:hypothetical protein
MCDNTLIDTLSSRKEPTLTYFISHSSAISHQFAQCQTAIRWLRWLQRTQANVSTTMRGASTCIIVYETRMCRLWSKRRHIDGNVQALFECTGFANVSVVRVSYILEYSLQGIGLSSEWRSWRPWAKAPTISVFKRFKPFLFPFSLWVGTENCL